MPRFRFTVRRLMIAVAIAAPLSGGEVMRRRRARSLDAAASHRRYEAIYREQAERVTVTFEGGRYRVRSRSAEGAEDFEMMTDRPDRVFYGPSAQNPRFDGLGWRERQLRTQAQWRRLAKARGEMRLKYERAARYPWLPVAPDPPEPE